MTNNVKGNATPLTGLDLLRAPFPDNQISKLPKPTRKQTDDVRADYKLGIRCKLCGGWHHPKVEHLDYVGHAALTNRLLDCDTAWNWEPMALAADGTPLFDAVGGMWIKLTVCGVTRMGYGHPDSKKGGDAIKEVIGDALRNAAMRFGAALDLWSKADLHAGPDQTVDQSSQADDSQQIKRLVSEPAIREAIKRLIACDSLGEMRHVWSQMSPDLRDVQAVLAAKDRRKAELCENLADGIQLETRP
jgi:hypothetical protein